MPLINKRDKLLLSVFLPHQPPLGDWHLATVHLATVKKQLTRARHPRNHSVIAIPSPSSILFLFPRLFFGSTWATDGPRIATPRQVGPEVRTQAATGLHCTLSGQLRSSKTLPSQTSLPPTSTPRCSAVPPSRHLCPCSHPDASSPRRTPLLIAAQLDIGSRGHRPPQNIPIALLCRTVICLGSRGREAGFLFVIRLSQTLPSFFPLSSFLSSCHTLLSRPSSTRYLLASSQRDLWHYTI